MRLINTASLELHEFFEGDIPSYAILSHRWTSHEVSYQTYGDRKHLSGPGIEKITAACELAQGRQRSWLWVDTCCIDKKSSAELSEAINSMYEWYANAVECYAYLQDVDCSSNCNASDILAAMSTSEWFLRGWTLQELIAPKNVFFYSKTWDLLGYKHCIYMPGSPFTKLNGMIKQITGIPKQVLANPRALRKYTIAQRISWASGRKTSRKEDEAYSLLGLLEVNIPLLYGERHKAFWRLQQELLRSSTDESLLAWQNLPTLDSSLRRSKVGGLQCTPLLAESPANFMYMGTVTRSFDVGIPRITFQSGLIVLQSGSLDECYLLDGRIYLVQLRCNSTYKNDELAIAPPSEANSHGLLALKELSCGHFERIHGLGDIGLNDIYHRHWQPAESKVPQRIFHAHGTINCAHGTIN